MQELEACGCRRVQRNHCLRAPLAIFRDYRHGQFLVANVAKGSLYTNERRWTQEPLLTTVGFLSDGRVKANDRRHVQQSFIVVLYMFVHRTSDFRVGVVIVCIF